MTQAAVLSLAALALVALATSLACGLVLISLRPWLGRLAAAAQARLVLVLALAPAAVGLGALLVAHAPSFGLGEDHCGAHGGHHAHLCFEHSLGELGAITWVVAAILVARVGLRAGHACRSVWRSRLARRGLGGATSNGGDVSVIDDPEPQAFVLGWLQPRLFITRALLDDVSEDERNAVLAHERAHARRRDPLRRLVAQVASAFHLPPIDRVIERRLALAHELAADEAAAGEVGDRPTVAGAILRIARRRAAPHGAAALGGADVAARVTSLLDERPRTDAPSAPLLLLAVTTLLVVGLVAAESIHHALEHALGVLF